MEYAEERSWERGLGEGYVARERTVGIVLLVVTVES